RSLIEASLDPLVTVNRDGKITDVNEATEKATGVPRDRLIGTDFAQYFTDPDKARAGYKRVLRKGVVWDYPLSLKSVSGSVIDVEYNATVYRDDAGEIQGLFAAARDITERKAAEERIRRLNRVYAILSGINQLIVRMRRPQALFEEVCRVIVEIGGFRAAWVGLVDPDGKRVRVVAQAGAIGDYLEKVDIILGDEERGRGPTGVSISERRHVTSQDIEHDPVMAPWRENALRQGYRASASFPLVVGDVVVGAFTIYAGEADFFDEEEIHLLDELAADISFAMEFAEGEEQRRRAEEIIRTNQAELEKAQRIGHFGNFDWDARTDTIVWSDEYYRIYGLDSKQPPLGYEEHLKVYSPESAARLDTAVSRSMQTGEPYELDLEQVRPDGTTSWVTARGEVKRDADGKIMGLRGTAQDITERKMAEEQYRDVLETAMDGFWLSDSNGHLLKVNDAYCRMSGYSEAELLSMCISDLDVIETPEEVDARAARILAQGSDRFESKHRRKDGSVFDVENSVRYQPESGLFSSFQRDITERKRIEELAAQQAERIERTLTSVVDIASNIVELRDPYTAGHQRRVSELAVSMAESLGMSGHEIDDIRVAGLLHDMGKAAIPTEILSKPGQLSPIEFTLIQGHAEAGYRLAVSANMVEPVAQMIYQHHERCDGSGYPRGLVGDQILSGAKVIAVADVVEAMMSHRPYRSALGIEAALAEIERGTGTLYDAWVAEACIRLF
ncbi:MAG TPA: PAS domain S-box protein, partial [Coriobacteriia bacterium]